MTRHGKMRLMLYEFVRGELGARDVRRVEEHIARCQDCAGEAAALRSVLHVFPDSPARPSGALPDSYWKGFANEVMGRIGPGKVREPGFVARLADRFAGLRAITRKLSIGLAAAMVAGAVLYAVLPRGPGGGPAPGGGDRIADRVTEQAAEGAAGEKAATRAGGSGDEPSGRTVEGSSGAIVEGSGREAAGSTPDPLTEFDRRLNDYFRRSKALIVGVSNLDPAGEETADLGTERSISRSLLSEARYLKTGPVDIRSYKLMDDLDQIMIGLANSDARSAAPTVEVIRGGIETKNLLFKLRMQETRNYSTPFRRASYRN